MVLSTIGPAKAELPKRSCQTLMRFSELHANGFQTATGDSYSSFSLPIAMASTA